VPGRSKYSVGEVFQSAGIPELTYVDRSGRPVLSELRNEVGHAGKLICIYGPSKSGKTVFCRKVLEKRKPILLRGNSIKSPDGFWTLLASHKGGRNRQELLQMLERDRTPIIIDDFHKIPEKTQRLLVDPLRTIANDGTTIVVISIYDFALKLFQADPELDGRVFGMKFPWWESSDIAKIGICGFSKLGLSVSKDVISALARFSCKTPILMQDACFLLCATELGINETLEVVSQKDVPAASLQKVFTTLAHREDPIFKRLRIRARPAVTLKVGPSLNICDAILYTLSLHQVVEPLTVIGLRRLLVRIVNETIHKVPPLADLREAVKTLAETSQSKLGLRSALVFDEDKIYIDHPHFFVWLRWSFAPTFGRELPNPFPRKAAY